MAEKKPIDAAGTPSPQHVFAVFDREDDLRAVEAALNAQSVHCETYGPDDAAKLQEPSPDAGIGGKIGRFVKGLGGERHMAERYALYLQEGRNLLAAPMQDPQAAELIARIMTSHGGYDVTYFRDLAIQYMSPSENVERGIPTHTHTNVSDE